MDDESVVSVDSEVMADVINVDDRDSVSVVKNSVSVGVNGVVAVGTSDVSDCGRSVSTIVGNVVEAASKQLKLHVSGYATAVASFVF